MGFRPPRDHSGVSERTLQFARDWTSYLLYFVTLFVLCVNSLCFVTHSLAVCFSPGNVEPEASFEAIRKLVGARISISGNLAKHDSKQVVKRNSIRQNPTPSSCVGAVSCLYTPMNRPMRYMTKPQEKYPRFGREADLFQEFLGSRSSTGAVGIHATLEHPGW